MVIEDNVDIGTKFGCAKGHGKFLPLEELILLQDFLPADTPPAVISPATDDGFPEYNPNDYYSRDTEIYEDGNNNAAQGFNNGHPPGTFSQKLLIGLLF